MPKAKALTPAQKKAQALTLLVHVHKDFDLLISGDWVPDAGSCEASQDGLRKAVRLLREAGALPPGPALHELVP
jgi:hypothetical protein